MHVSFWGFSESIKYVKSMLKRIMLKLDIFLPFFIEVELTFNELHIFRQTWHGFSWYFPGDIDHSQLKEYAHNV